MNEQIKVSIGCRVTPEKKIELLTKAKEEGYTSFSQYLESLILKSSSEEASINEDAKLTEIDLDNIEVRISTLLDDKELNKEIETDSEEEEGDFLVRFAEILEYTNDEDKERFTNFFNGDFTKEEMIEFLSIEESLKVKIEDEIKESLGGDYNKFLNIELKDENRKLLIEFLTFLLEERNAVNKQGALIGSIKEFLDHQDGVFGDSKIVKLFLNRFEAANDEILKEAA